MKNNQNFKITSFCNNCGRKGHCQYNCNEPIISVGIICYRERNGVNEYLLIRRKDTLGYVDFIRGKYHLCNELYLSNIFQEMTEEEKTRIRNHDFNKLWNDLWGNQYRNKHKNEYFSSEKKFSILKNGVVFHNEIVDISTLLDRHPGWKEQEWGFPKGRKNVNENDLETAVREFCEETGYHKDDIRLILNMRPYEEVFTGSNFKSYIHKYYIAKLEKDHYKLNRFQKTEVSDIEWMSYSKCMEKIRDYNLERIDILKKVENVLNKYIIM